MIEVHEVYPDSGLTKDNGIHQMIPVKGERYLAVRNAAKCKFKLESGDCFVLTEIKPEYVNLPEVTDANSTDRVIKIMGLKAGETKLSIQTSNSSDVIVHLYAMRKTMLKVAFYSVSDGVQTQNGECRATIVSPSATTEFVKKANDIFFRKANCAIEMWGAAQWVHVAEDLGEVVTVDKNGKGEARVILERACPVPENVVRVFFVWDTEVTGDDGKEAGWHSGNMICIGDRPSGTGTIVAHEIGHALGLSDIRDKTDNLMFHTNAYGGTGLLPKQVKSIVRKAPSF